ncbi:MAG: DUF2807 domain-containing protein [Verrucomicrobia bacterium]|nr:DUF2807 domain-containing protein [Verrucomicrobiota bacterium]
MPVTLETVQFTIPAPPLNEALKPLSPPNHPHNLGQWTLAQKVAVCFLAFLGVCALLQMIRARNSTVAPEAEKSHAGKKNKMKASRDPSKNFSVSVSNGILRFSNSPGTPFIEESSTLKQEELRLSSFSAIEIRLPAHVNIVKGDTQKVTLAATQNIFDLLVAKVEGAWLILEAKPQTAFETRQPLQYTIVIPSLREIKVTTAAQVSISKLREESFKCWVEGDSQVEVAGQVTDQEVKVRDAAIYLGRHLTSDKTTLQIDGVGKAHVKAVHQLTGLIRDTGDCTYYGEPSRIRTLTTKGNGRICCHIDVYTEL